MFLTICTFTPHPKAVGEVLEGLLLKSREAVKKLELKISEQATALKEAEVRLAAKNEQILLLNKEKEDRQNRDKKSDVAAYWEELDDARGD
ncbi:hypothetical protein FRC09_015064 [Ceratobasidium sp. 395]|nr:hypothetical protein FRC09_015064 [Ceratobasidium sp. 395]